MGTDQKINVCHLVSGDLWAGAEVQAYTLLKELYRERSLNLSAIILNPGELASRLKETGVDTVALDESRDNFLRLRRKAIDILKGKNIDIIHSHRYKENILAALVRDLCGVKRLVQTIHGVSEMPKGYALLKARIYGAANRVFTRRYFDRIITVSDDIRQRLHKSLPQSRMVTVHNAVDPQAIRPEKSAETVKREFNIDVDAPLIGAAGRMVPVKAYDKFLEMAKIILESRPDARFMLVGDGPLLQPLKQLSKDMGIADNVIFTGFREDIFDIINAFDLFVFSSYHEGVPMALLEAMSLRKAVVSTAVGGVVEVIENEVSGLLVEPGSTTALAGACLGILKRPELKSALENGAYARIDVEFNIEVQARKVFDLYKELITGSES